MDSLQLGLGLGLGLGRSLNDSILIVVGGPREDLSRSPLFLSRSPLFDSLLMAVAIVGRSIERHLFRVSVRV